MQKFIRYQEEDPFLRPRDNAPFFPAPLALVCGIHIRTFRLCNAAQVVLMDHWENAKATVSGTSGIEFEPFRIL